MRRVAFDNAKNIILSAPKEYDYVFSCGIDCFYLEGKTIEALKTYTINRSWLVSAFEDETGGVNELTVETRTLILNPQNLRIELSSTKPLQKQATLRYCQKNDLIAKNISTMLDKTDPYIEISNMGTIEFGSHEGKWTQKENSFFDKRSGDLAGTVYEIKELIVSRGKELRDQLEKNKSIEANIKRMEAEYQSIQKQIQRAEENLKKRRKDEEIAGIYDLETDVLCHKNREELRSLKTRIETDTEMAEDTIFAIREQRKRNNTSQALAEEENKAVIIKDEFCSALNEIMNKE